MSDNNTTQGILDTLAASGIIDAPAPAQTQQQETPPPVQEPAPVEPQSTNQQEANNQPNTPPPAEPQFDFSAELVKATGGAVKSPEEIMAALEGSKRVGDLERQLQELQQQSATYKEKAEANPFANDLTAKLDSLYRSGAKPSQIEAFLTINKVDNLESLSPIDAKLLALQVKNGLSSDEAKTYLNSAYKLDPDKYDQATIDQDTIRLKVDAQADREFLKTHKAEVSTPPVPQNDAQAQQLELQRQQSEHMNKLLPRVDNVLKTISFKGISLNGKKDADNITADFDVSEDSLKTMKGHVDQFIQNSWNSIPADERGDQMIAGYAENILVLQNWRNWMQNASGETEKRVRAEYANPSSIPRGNDAKHSGQNQKQALGEWLLKNSQ